MEQSSEHASGFASNEVNEESEEGYGDELMQHSAKK